MYIWKNVVIRAPSFKKEVFFLAKRDAIKLRADYVYIKVTPLNVSLL